MKKIIILAALLVSTALHAISEINYAKEYKEKIIPLIGQYKNGSFLGEKNVSIHYATYTSNPNSTRCLFILPGRTEPIEKYAEVIHSLDTGKLAGEFVYFLMDHRGQGSSGRMLTKKVADYEKGHVDHFKNYRLDFKRFIDRALDENKCAEKFLLAHSLGGGIAVDFLQHYPEYFDRAALTSPMLKIQTEPYKYAIARSIVLANMGIGRGHKFAIGQEAYDGTRNFEANPFTTSPARYEMAMNMYDLFPKARLGGVTFRWLNEVMMGTAKMRKNYNDIKIPLRVIHAGLEYYSSPKEMIRFCEEAPYCNRIFLPTSKHEVLMDRDVNRDVVIAELEKFFKH